MTHGETGPADVSEDELRERYRIERAKRLRAEGNAQYFETSRVHGDLDADPFVEPGFTRDPIIEEVEVVIIGAGFGGMIAAANLRKEGVDSFRMIDKAGDFGGT